MLTLLSERYARIFLIMNANPSDSNESEGFAKIGEVIGDDPFDS